MQEAKGGQAGLGGMAVPCPYSSAARVRTRTSRCRWSSGGRMTESRATRVAASIVFFYSRSGYNVEHDFGNLVGGGRYSESGHDYAHPRPWHASA